MTGGTIAAAETAARYERNASNGLTRRRAETGLDQENIDAFI
jgi:hypothetical protein